jgi:glycosyltransferase involved in cell wall biosynthesis
MISVVVCTKDRPEQLEKCLKSLDAQNFFTFEVIVVDSGDIDKTKDIASKLTAKITVLSEPRKGLSIARNTGIDNAKGEIISFTDDDCEVDKNWLSEIKTAMEKYGLDAVIGQIVPKGEGKHTSVVQKEKPQEIKFPKLVGHGNNMSFRREVFEDIRFDPRLGVGTKFPGADDYDVFYKLLKSGGKVRYEPKVLVPHNAPLTDEQFDKVMINYAVGLGAFIAKEVKEDDPRVPLGYLFGVFSKRSFEIIINPLMLKPKKAKLAFFRLEGLLSGFFSMLSG